MKIVEVWPTGSGLNIQHQRESSKKTPCLYRMPTHDDGLMIAKDLRKHNSTDLHRPDGHLIITLFFFFCYNKINVRHYVYLPYTLSLFILTCLDIFSCWAVLRKSWLVIIHIDLYCNVSYLHLVVSGEPL